MERYVLRDETFGGTLYDRQLLRHRFVSHNEINSGIGNNGAEIEAQKNGRAMLGMLLKVYFMRQQESILN